MKKENKDISEKCTDLLVPLTLSLKTNNHNKPNEKNNSKLIGQRITKF